MGTAGIRVMGACEIMAAFSLSIDVRMRMVESVRNTSNPICKEFVGVHGCAIVQAM